MVERIHGKDEVSSSILDQGSMNMNEKINTGYVELDNKHYVAVEDSRDWRDNAACKGMDTNVFMPETRTQTREAVVICAGCLVVNDCLKYALNNEIHFGIWGGKTDRERRQIQNNPKLLNKILKS